MRLIRIKDLELKEFDHKVPPYIILSHTWDDEEITLEEFKRGQGEGKVGWEKIKGFCEAVRRHNLTGVEYIWVDTCCIDKTSSADLSESINSMFRWYRHAHCCYAFLTDVTYTENKDNLERQISRSRWFTRGWTLQELLAPREVVFFDQNWKMLGARWELAPLISKTTEIPYGVLRKGDFKRTSTAQRMSWAAGRNTTRPEDVAYCLLGIFDVNMSLLYGEGEKAFIRLQEKILMNSRDQSIFAWDASLLADEDIRVGLLAPSPEYFAGAGIIGFMPEPESGAMSITNRGISLQLPFGKKVYEKAFARLSCYIDNNPDARVIIEVETGGQIPPENWDPMKVYSRRPRRISHTIMEPESKDSKRWKDQRITMRKQNELNPSYDEWLYGSLAFSPQSKTKFEWLETYPERFSHISEMTDAVCFEVESSSFESSGTAEGIAVCRLREKCPGTVWGVHYSLQQDGNFSINLVELTEFWDRADCNSVADLLIGTQDNTSTVGEKLIWRQEPRRGYHPSRNTAAIELLTCESNITAKLEDRTDYELVSQMVRITVDLEPRLVHRGTWNVKRRRASQAS